MIVTARLILRQYRESDRAAFRAMMADPEVNRDGGGPLAPSDADALFARRGDHIAAHGFGKWALENRADGAFLGFVGVTTIWPGLPVAPGREIGWRMVRAAWGHGYATEAARASLRDVFARTATDEVISFTQPENARSLAVMPRVGLARDASRDFLYETGLPAVVFAARRADWERSEPR
jgi:ribosomal-protein-alanine N-acetyltransferase